MVTMCLWHMISYGGEGSREFSPRTCLPCEIISGPCSDHLNLFLFLTKAA